MKALNKEQALELLKKGATIEFTTWGDNYPINISLGNEWHQVHRAAFNSLAQSKTIKFVKQERLSQTWKLATLQLKGETKQRNQ
jgi:hypothetical protein